MSFTAQIGQITGSASTNDATTIAQGLENAQLEVIQKVSQVQPEMLHLLSSEAVSTSNDDGDNTLVNNIVLNVNRADGTSGYLDTSPASNSYVTVDSASLSSDAYNGITSTSGASFSFWIKFLNDDTSPIFTSSNGNTNSVSNNAGWRIVKGSDRKLYLQWGTTSGSFSDDNASYYRRVTAQNILTSEVWYHVAIITSFGHTGNTKIYINGIECDIKETGSYVFSGTSPEYNGHYAAAYIGYHIKLNDGGSPTTTYGDFHLRNFGIFKGKLSEAQAKTLYNNNAYFDLRNSTGDYTSSDKLHVYWDFTTTSLEDLMDNHTATLSLQNSAVVTNYRYDASFIDRKYVNKVKDLNSLYYADAVSPVYTINKGKVEIYPAPTSTESANITKVVPGAIDDNAETIANMPRFLHNQVVRIASYYVLLKRIGDVRDSLPTDLNDTTVFDAIADFNDSIGVTTSLPSVGGDYSDAITKAKNLIDDATQLSTDTEDAEYWLKEEDPEMLQSTLSTAAQELQRAQSVLSGHSAEINKYQAEISKESAEAGQALQEYQANLTKKIQFFTTLIGKLNTDYQWMTAQLGIIKNMIDEGWVSIFTPNANNDVSRVGVGS